MIKRLLITACFLYANTLLFSPAHAEVLSVFSDPSGAFTLSQYKGKLDRVRLGALSEQSGEKVEYTVDATIYQGILSWKISWRSEMLESVYYARRSDNAPLYIKRVNHALQRHVEILYSLTVDKPHIYRSATESELIERKIWDKQLIDFEGLPQRLAAVVSAQQEKIEKVRFNSINYSDGKVYPIHARFSGFKYITIMNNKVRCAVYSVNVDSWKAAFSHPVLLVIPTMVGYGAFVAYQGPSPEGNGEIVTLLLNSWSSQVASR